MKKNEIKIGGHCSAKVNGKVVTVRVDKILVGHVSVKPGKEAFEPCKAVYHVTNLSTGHKLTFRSAAKFCTESRPTPEEHYDAIAEKQIAPSKTAFEKYKTEAEQRSDPTPASASIRRSSPVAAAASSAGSSSSSTPLAAALKAQVTDRLVDDSPHLIVEARAGTGKTTTLVEGLRRIKGAPTPGFVPSPQQQAVFDAMELSRGKVNSICFVAFNKSIADELKTRVPAGCEAMTMHSMGFRAIRKVFPRVDAGDKGKWLVTDLIAEIVGQDIRELRRDPKWVVAIKATEELVGLCKMNLVGGPGKFSGLVHDSAGTPALYCWDEKLDWDCAMSDLASHYNVDLNGSRDRVFDLVPKVLERCKDVARNGRINFDDMIWIPVILNLPVERYDLLLIDERQDLNRCQMQLALKAGKRIAAVGDEKQSIYGFAGADPAACRTFKTLLEGTGRAVVELPLTVTRRCGKAIVAEARRIVPDFEAFETNPEGLVRSKPYNGPDVGGTNAGVPINTSYRADVNEGDFILCRVNAPLVKECFRFIKAGRKANIQGRDVGRGLISTVEKLAAGEAISVVELIRRLGEWLAHEQAKKNAKREPSENRMTALQDRHDCLMCFCDGAAASTDVIAKINAVFTDDKQSPGIKLSSIHKAKGLEARRVFILQPKGVGPRTDKMKPWELEQESNLRYVAITRAIEELIYVT